MPLKELNLLIFALIGLDTIIIILFIFLIRRLKHFNKMKSFHRTVKMYESLIRDTDKVTAEFREQMGKKHHLIRKLNEQLDKRIIDLNSLLNRADVLLSSRRNKVADKNGNMVNYRNQQMEIMALAEEGRSAEEIANRLSIPKEEVKLILNLTKRFTRIDRG